MRPLVALMMPLLLAAAAPAPPAPPTVPALKVVLQIGHQTGADLAAWTIDSRSVLTASTDDHSLIIWDARSGAIVDHIRLPTMTEGYDGTVDGLVSLTPAPDGKTARLVVQSFYFGNGGGGSRFITQPFTLDLAKRTWTPGRLGPVAPIDRTAKGPAAFPPAPDGRLRLDRAGGLKVVSTAPGHAHVATLDGETANADTSVAISPDGRLMATLGWTGGTGLDDTTVTVMDLTSGSFLPPFTTRGQYWSVQWIDDGRYLVGEEPDYYLPNPAAVDPAKPILPALLVDAAGARILARYDPRCGTTPVGSTGAMIGVGLARCTGSRGDGGLWLSDRPGPAPGDAEKPRWRPLPLPALAGRTIQAVAVSPDGLRLAVVSSGAADPVRILHAPQRIEIIDLATRTTTSRMTLHPGSRASGLRWSADGRVVLMTGGFLQVWRPGMTLTDLNIENVLPELAVTDGDVVLTGSMEQPGLEVYGIRDDERDWATTSGSGTFDGGFLSGRHVYWTASIEGGVRFYDTRSNDKLLTLFTFPEGKFFALDPHGRYDTNLGADSARLRWLVSDDPWRSLAPQTFIRDYFEPGLIARTIDCTAAGSCAGKFRDPPPVTVLNRTLPEVEIAKVEPGAVDGTAQVSLIVRQTTDPAAANGKTRSGAFDLRLFRDGRLVAEYPPPERADATADWPARTRLIEPGDPAPLPLTLTVPVASGAGRTAFSAYAFNEDRVKGATATAAFVPPRPVARPRRAYLVTIGIDAYDAPGWRLHFAAGDAVALSRALGTIAGYELVPVRLVATGPARAADRARLDALFRLLGGDETARAILTAGGLDVSGIRRVTPDDAVIVSFAGHGYTDRQGDFYLVPQDGAQGPDGTPDLSTLISSARLTDWLRPVDAGEMALIIDACHSAASVRTATFKPAPLGDPGLGQLAFDKRIRILAATQGDDVAMESATLRHGLLTYALAEEGLTAGRADLDGDGAITLDELLRYAERRLPQLSEASTVARPATLFPRTLIPDPASAAPPPRRQQPALFDFTDAPSRLVVRRVKPAPTPAR